MSRRKEKRDQKFDINCVLRTTVSIRRNLERTTRDGHDPGLQGSVWIALFHRVPYEIGLRNQCQIMSAYAPSDELRKACQAPECDWNVAVFYLQNGLVKVRQLRCGGYFWGQLCMRCDDAQRTG